MPNKLSCVGWWLHQTEIKVRLDWVRACPMSLETRYNQKLLKVNLSNNFLGKLVYFYIDRFFNFQRFAIQHGCFVRQLATRADLNFSNE